MSKRTWADQQAKRAERERRRIAERNACAGIPTEALEGADVKALVEVVQRLEPHLDAIICYASTMGEHEPNQIAHDLRAAVAPFRKD